MTDKLSDKIIVPGGPAVDGVTKDPQLLARWVTETIDEIVQQQRTADQHVTLPAGKKRDEIIAGFLQTAEIVTRHKDSIVAYCMSGMGIPAHRQMVQMTTQALLGAWTQGYGAAMRDAKNVAEKAVADAKQDAPREVPELDLDKLTNKN